MTNYLLGKVVGSDGNGIESIELIDTTGLVKTYRITYTDGNYFDFEVTDGEDGSANIVTSWESTLSDSKVASEKLTKNTIDTKLSSNQGSGNAGKYLKVDSDGSVIPASGGGVDIVTSWESTPSDSKVPSEKLVKDTLDTKANSSSLSTVATTGDYDDLTDKPTIPSKISDLTNDSDFIEKSQTAGLVKNDGTIDTTSYSTFSGSYTDLSNKPSIPSSSSDLSDGSDIVKKSNTSGLIKNDGTIDTTSYISSLPSASTSTAGIVQLVDNLTTNDDTKALTAKQGKAIKDLIGASISYINQ